MNNYFPHDSNSRNSDKLLPVRMKYGAEGYGIYFMILERLREEKNYKSVKDYNMLAFDLRVDTSKLKAIVEDFGLFVFTEDGEYFYSEGFNKRMEIKDEKSKKKSEAGKKGAAKRWQKNSSAIAEPLTKNSSANAVAKEKNSKERKVKETKEKESKVNKNKANNTDVLFERFLQIFSDFTKGIKSQPRSRASAAFVDLGTEERRQQAIIGAKNYVTWYKSTGEGIKYSINAAKFLEDMTFMDYQEVPMVKEKSNSYSKAGKAIPNWATPYQEPEYSEEEIADVFKD